MKNYLKAFAIALAFGAGTYAALGRAQSAQKSADPVYMGTWKIAAVEAAPWVPADRAQFSPYDAMLLGKTITFEPRRIVAPSVLACKGPRYEVRRVGADYLFQGGLTDPDKQAQALGFRSTPIVTLMTGCEGWFEFHFLDARTAMFALDNRIFTIRAN